jgi:DNA-binding winged helix-turn-helix (wHTH) protein/TolB-like protein
MDQVSSAFPSLGRIELAREADFILGPLKVRPSRREVMAAGSHHILQRRVMQVLVALARPTSEVVSHAELIRRCWGGLAVSEDAIGRCIGQLRRFAEQWPEPPFQIETIAGVGYQLKAGSGGMEPSEASPEHLHRGRWRSRAVLATAVLATMAAGMWLLIRAPGAEPAQRPTVAVTPFRLLAGDRTSAGFAARVSDELVELLNENGVRTTSAGAGRRGDLTLGGTVYEEGGVTRVRVELDDPRARLTLWSAQFESPSANSPHLREQVAGAAGEAIFTASEPQAQDGLTIAPAALALFIKAEEEVKSPELLKEGEAVRAAQEAVGLAPNFAAARGLLALAIVESAPFSQDPGKSDSASRRAEAEARRAILISPAHADAAYEALNILADAQAPSDLVAHEDRILAGLAKEPDFPFLNMRECRFLVNVGRPRAALRYCQRAIALRPLADPIGWSYAAALYSAGQEDLARRELARATAFHPNHNTIRAWNFELEAFSGSLNKAHAILHDPDQTPQSLSPESVAALDAMLNARESRTPAAVDAAMKALWDANRNHRMPKRYVGLSAAVLGRHDEAFAALQDTSIGFPEPFDLFQPPAASLWTDLRFWRLAAHRGLVSYWRARKIWPDICSALNGSLDCQKLVAAAGL